MKCDKPRRNLTASPRILFATLRRSSRKLNLDTLLWKARSFPLRLEHRGKLSRELFQSSNKSMRTKYPEPREQNIMHQDRMRVLHPTAFRASLHTSCLQSWIAQVKSLESTKPTVSTFSLVDRYFRPANQHNIMASLLLHLPVQRPPSGRRLWKANNTHFPETTLLQSFQHHTH